MRRLLLFSVAAVLPFMVTPAFAEPTTDNFWVWIFEANEFLDGGGTGFNDGTGVPGPAGPTRWYYYPNTGWYNQWFYDAPPDPTRWKEITYDISINATAHVIIALNWTTLAYPETGPGGPPPLPPLDPALEQDWIVREVIFDDDVDTVVIIGGTLIIPDYNPEWVSIDVVTSGSYAFIDGTITHECIPAPGAVLLGSIGVGLVGWLRRRRTL